jgi:hypothetical protein
MIRHSALYDINIDLIKPIILTFIGKIFWYGEYLTNYSKLIPFYYSDQEEYSVLGRNAI